MLKKVVIVLAVLFSFTLLSVPVHAGALEKVGEKKTQLKKFPFKMVYIQWKHDRVWLVKKEDKPKYYLFMVTKLTPEIKEAGLRLGDLVSGNKHALYYPKGSHVGIKSVRMPWTKGGKIETPYFIPDMTVLLGKKAICWKLVKDEFVTIDFSKGKEQND